MPETLPRWTATVDDRGVFFHHKLLDDAMDGGDNGPGSEYDVYPKHFAEVYDRRRKQVGKQLYALLEIPKGDAAGMLRQVQKNYDFFDAPVGMILCVDHGMGNGQWIDCGIFLDQQIGRAHV